jgi:hypothetical protein
MKTEEKEHTYSLKIYNGRVKVYCDEYVMFAFTQLDLVGWYFFKDDTNVLGLTIHFLREKAGAGEMDIYFKTKKTWLEVNKLMDENL